jgi:tRNA 5-methylaminomethyl-2-thiouridine biosynthesis bifunctional protein
VGATYGLNDVETNERDEDHQTNVSQLLQNIPSLAESVTAGSLRGAAAIRCATSDYLPIVGSVPNETEFNATFAGLRHDRKQIIDAKQPNYLGLWLMTGLGSRGLTSAPILAEVLVSQMFRRAPPLPRYLLQAISPARFLKRRLIRGN